MQTYYAPLVMFGCCMLAVARLAGKVGGLTEVFFTGLCGALPAPKCRAGGLMGGKGARRWAGRLFAGAIKAVVILCLFALTARQAKATNCSSRTFQEEKINLYFCQNYSNDIETRALLYKAKTMILNDYIKDKIAKGELQDKKFEIQIWDSILTHFHLGLTQGRNGYFVSFSWFPTLHELKTIVDYFSIPDWKPFIAGYYDWEKQRYEDGASRRVSNFFQQYTTADTITYQPVTAWEKDGVSLQYADGSMRYLIDGAPLPFKANSKLPVKIQDRHLFFQQDSIFVVQDMQTINKIERDDDYSDNNINVQAHSKWVNIGGWREDNWFYSYSYEQNRFFINENRR